MIQSCPDDPYAGQPDDVDAWLAELSPAELEAMLTNPPDIDDGAACDVTAGVGFADGGWLDGLVPGAVLSSFSQDVAEAGLGALTDDELVGVLRAARRLASWQAAVEFRAVGELDARRMRESGRPGWSRLSEHTSSELAAALTLTGRSADALLCVSRDLARLPMVLRALYEGRIDRARAEVFASELAALGDEAAAAIAKALCDLAGSMTTGQLRNALRRLVLAADPAAARRRAAKARADARVESWTESSGNAGLSGRELPSADAIAADRRISAIAKALKKAGAPGTMDQLRAAVFLALLTGRDPEPMKIIGEQAEPGAKPRPGGQADNRPGSQKPAPAAAPGSRHGASCPEPSAARHDWWNAPGLGGSVNLTMPLSAWLGQSERPGEVAGFGPLDADTCRELADQIRRGPQARWCVTLTGRDGRAVAHACSRAGPGPPGTPGSDRSWLGRLRFARIERGICGHAHRVNGYQPGRTLRKLVKVRQRTCSFPGCRRPAVACDDDHTIPYERGGMTCECNLSPLCRKHHQAKQAPGWSLAQPEPGMLVWTVPHGRRYVSRPEPYPV